MEAVDSTKGMEALQAPSEGQQTRQKDVERLGKNLGQLKARLAAEVEGITREVDGGKTFRPRVHRIQRDLE